MMFYNLITRVTAKIIAIGSPRKAAEYLAEHRFFSRAYTAAKKSGVDKGWRVTQSSGANENASQWQAVTNKARDLSRNNPYIVGARRRFRSNIISEGVWPRPKIRARNGKNKFDLDKEKNQEILDAWELWCRVAGANGDSIYQIQRTAANHFFDDGQFLARRVFFRKFPYMRIELLECDQLDSSRDRLADGVNNRIVGGIELDKFNKPVAYYLLAQHPGDGYSSSQKVPASEIIHVFDRQRASEVSGICGYASVVQSTFRAQEYAYSTMDAARIANHFGVWIESPYIDDYGQESDDLTEIDNIEEARYKRINPAAFHYGLPGEKPHQIKPEIPGSQYGPFMTKELQAISVGAGVGYESVSHDGSQSNFAGSRALLLVERGYTKLALATFEEQFHSKIYEWFIEGLMDFGRPPLILPDYKKNPMEYLRVRFSRPVQEWVDPWKDVAARGKRIELNLSTETDEAEDVGQDIEEIYAKKAYEKELKKQFGLKTESVDNTARPESGTVEQQDESEGENAEQE